VIKRVWEGGKVATHAELDEADALFWERAGAAARLVASMQFPRDLVEMLSAFDNAKVRYLVIGGPRRLVLYADTLAIASSGIVTMQEYGSSSSRPESLKHRVQRPEP
jgi:hypothetical protein